MRQKIKNKNKIKTSLGSKIFDIINVIVMFGLMLIRFYPMVHILFASFSGGNALLAHTGLRFWPVDFSLEGYKMVFKDPMIVKGYMNTLFVVLVGSSISLVLTALGAYFLSRNNVMLQSPVMLYLIFTMFFSGGMIPFYFTVKQLGLYNSLWSLLLPTAMNALNLIIMRTSFAGLPDSLEEAAKIDGANDFQVLIKVMLPMSMATIAVMTLFYAETHWNVFFNPMIYLKTREKFPLQVLLRELLITNSTDNLMQDVNDDKAMIAQVIKYSTIIVSTLPILVVYPFLQRYFTKGVMLGAIKG